MDLSLVHQDPHSTPLQGGILLKADMGQAGAGGGLGSEALQSGQIIGMGPDGDVGTAHDQCERRLEIGRGHSGIGVGDDPGDAASDIQSEIEQVVLGGVHTSLAKIGQTLDGGLQVINQMTYILIKAGLGGGASLLGAGLPALGQPLFQALLETVTAGLLKQAIRFGLSVGEDASGLLARLSDKPVGFSRKVVHVEDSRGG